MSNDVCASTQALLSRLYLVFFMSFHLVEFHKTFEFALKPPNDDQTFQSTVTHCLVDQSVVRVPGTTGSISIHAYLGLVVRFG